jgi:Domain of unknown function (DUF1707)
VNQQRADLRAADVDRAFVADLLKAAVDQGRLSLSEYDERLQRAYAARTYGDLDAVIADLPAPAAPARSAVAPYAASGLPVAPPTEHRRVISGWLAGVWTAWLVAVSVNVVIWLLVSFASGEVVYPWPIWVAGPWGAVLLAFTIAGLLRGEPYREAEKRADKQAERKARKQRGG